MDTFAEAAMDGMQGTEETHTRRSSSGVRVTCAASEAALQATQFHRRGSLDCRSRSQSEREVKGCGVTGKAANQEDSEDRERSRLRTPSSLPRRPGRRVHALRLLLKTSNLLLHSCTHACRGTAFLFSCESTRQLAHGRTRTIEGAGREERERERLGSREGNKSIPRFIIKLCLLVCLLVSEKERERMRRR